MMKRKSLSVLVLVLVFVLLSVGVLAEGAATQYTVTFNFNGSTQADVTKQVDSGKSVAGVTPEPRTGYTFAEWCYDEAGTQRFNFSTPITSNLELYAKWIANEYKVTFNLMGAPDTGTDYNEQKVSYGGCVAPVPLPVWGDAGAFGGWYTDIGCTQAFAYRVNDTQMCEFTTPVTDDMTLYAKWPQHTVTFVSDHGVAPRAQNVAHGSKAVNPGDLVDPAWKFDGWYLRKDDTSLENDPYDFDTPVTKDITICAKWTQLHMVTFNLMGHGAVVKPQTVEDKGNVVKPADPTAEGYEFVHWYTLNEYNSEVPVIFDSNNKSTLEITQDTELYAKWTATVTVTGEWKKAITHDDVNDPNYSNTPIQVQLLANGQPVEGYTATLYPRNEDNTVSWDGLIADRTYSVEEYDMQNWPNFTAVCTQVGVNSFKITNVENEKIIQVQIKNTHRADTIDIVISKSWDDNNNQHRPENIQVKIYWMEGDVKHYVKAKDAAGEETADDLVLTLNAGNSWTNGVNGLYRRQSGQSIRYIIEEINNPKGYTAALDIVTDENGNYTVRITNVLTGKVDIYGEKIWDDDNNRDGIRPDKAYLKIYENAKDKLIATVAVDNKEEGSTDTVWKWKILGLPVYDENNQVITYIVSEDPVPKGYTASPDQYIRVEVPSTGN